MVHTTRPSAPPVRPLPPARPLAAGPSSATHLARCGTCGDWLHLDEDELLKSLDDPPVCWKCALNDPDDAPAPA